MLHQVQSKKGKVHFTAQIWNLPTHHYFIPNMEICVVVIKLEGTNSYGVEPDLEIPLPLPHHHFIPSMELCIVQGGT